MRDRQLERVPHERQVALEELVLQRLGAGGDDHLAAVQERGDEIREGLAGAGAGLGDERAAPGDGGRDGIGHRELLRTEAEAGQRPGEEAAFAQDRDQLPVGSGGVAVGIGGERGAAQFALLDGAGAAAAVAALPCRLGRLPLAVAALPLPAAAGALPLSATSTARIAVARSLKIS